MGRIKSGYAIIWTFAKSIIFLPNGFFPAKQLTHEIMTGEYRRYHLHETNVQKAIKQAISAATAMRGISPSTGHWR